MATTHRIGAALALAIGCLTMAVSSCVSAPPQDDAEQIGSVAQAVGGAVGDWTGFTDGQCVHGVYQFYLHRFGISLTGACAQPGNIGNCQNCGACMIWKSAAVEPSPSLFNRYDWGTTMPQTYDIVVYPPKTAGVGPGHVACVDHIDGADPSDWHAMYVMDSNWYGNEKMATDVHTVTRAPYGIYRLKALENPAPKGYLDGADCTAVTGWTQDPSDPTKAINADLYFDGPAGDAKAIGVRLLAGTDRPDLCAPLGSCNHSYSIPTPRGAMDGADHKVYAYGIDTTGGSNPLLSDAPKSFNCTAPTIPANVAKRALTSMDVSKAWQFQLYFDMAVYSTPDVGAVATGTELPSAPVLLQVAGQDEIDVVDGSERRAISGMTSFAAWRFTTDMVTAVDASALAAYPKGLDWPATPLLIKSADADTVYMLDDVPAGSSTVGTSGADPSTGSSTPLGGGGSGAANDPTGGQSSSKGCSVGGASNDAETAWMALPLMGILLARRRRAR